MALSHILALLAVIIWGWTFVASKICLEVMSPIALIGVRFLIGLPLLAGIMRWRGIAFDMKKTDSAPLIFGAIILCAHFIVQNVALTYTSASATAWIITVTPLVMAVLSFVIFKERIGRAQITGIVVATVGVFTLVSQGDFSRLGGIENIGDALALVSAHTWALYSIVTRPVTARCQPLAVTVAVFTPVMTVCLAIALARGEIGNFAHWDARVVTALLFLAILGTLAQWFWLSALSRLGVAKMGMYLYAEPIATTALAIPLLGESFTFIAGLGGALIIFGVWIAQKNH